MVFVSILYEYIEWAAVGKCGGGGMRAATEEVSSYTIAAGCLRVYVCVHARA